LGPQSEALAVLLDDYFLEGTQILLNIRPLKGVPRPVQTPVELLSKYQRRERAEHMSPDGVITLVENGPRRSAAQLDGDPGR
jgi:hypothetical protein